MPTVGSFVCFDPMKAGLYAQLLYTGAFTNIFITRGKLEVKDGKGF